MKALILSLAILIPGVAQAADERARVDLNGHPSLLGVSDTTGELRRIKVNNVGIPLVASSGTFSTSGSTVSVVNADGTFISIDDGGNTITVDGTVAATQSGTWVLGANSGVDIGDTTNNNAGGASAVNIQDGGNSITIDGTVSTDDSGNDTIFLSTHAVSGSAVEVMAADADRESSIICNEGPEIARVGDSANLTASVGQRILVDECYSPDGSSKPFRGAYSAISTTGSPTKITATEGS